MSKQISLKQYTALRGRTTRVTWHVRTQLRVCGAGVLAALCRQGGCLIHSGRRTLWSDSGTRQPGQWHRAMAGRLATRLNRPVVQPRQKKPVLVPPFNLSTIYHIWKNIHWTLNPSALLPHAHSACALDGCGSSGPRGWVGWVGWCRRGLLGEEAHARRSPLAATTLNCLRPCTQHGFRGERALSPSPSVPEKDKKAISVILQMQSWVRGGGGEMELRWCSRLV